MTLLVPTSTSDPQSATAARVSFRQPVTRTGFIDAGWWPRSHDLTAELPALLAVLWTASREIIRVSYSLDFWDEAPRRLQVEGRGVRLGGFHHLSPLLMTAVDARNNDRIDFLVIPPETEPRIALRALELASTADELNNPADILEQARV
jgi:uncharacterized protein DUF5994